MVLKHIAILAVVGMCCSACSSKVERDFISGCRQGGAPKSICECTFKKLKEKYSEKTLERMSEYGYAPDDFMHQVMKASEQCIAED
jgi:hypothetical protein